MRVITGSAKGRKLKAPKGLATRPTTDRVKEALFSILGNRVQEAQILDLFAGSGALAIEALSRGAARAVLVETNSEALQVIKENLTATRLTGQVEMVNQDVYQVLPTMQSKQQSYDLIFLDPPYYQGHEIKVLELIGTTSLLAKEGLVVVESGKKDTLPAAIANLALQRRENYGDSSLYFYSWQIDGSNGERRPGMKTAVYPGSFDPITNGHLDIIARASAIFDEVIVAVSTNVSKNPFFSMAERVELITVAIAPYPNVKVDSFCGLTAEYVHTRGAHIIIRGLRAVSDFEGEFQMAVANKKLQPEVETLFMMSKTEYSFLSSSLIKEIAKYNGCIKGFVPNIVEVQLQEKINNNSIIQE